MEVMSGEELHVVTAEPSAAEHNEMQSVAVFEEASEVEPAVVAPSEALSHDGSGVQADIADVSAAAIAAAASATVESGEEKALTAVSTPSIVPTSNGRGRAKSMAPKRAVGKAVTTGSKSARKPSRKSLSSTSSGALVTEPLESILSVTTEANQDASSAVSTMQMDQPVEAENDAVLEVMSGEELNVVTAELSAVDETVASVSSKSNSRARAKSLAPANISLISAQDFLPNKKVTRNTLSLVKDAATEVTARRITRKSVITQDKSSEELSSRKGKRKSVTSSKDILVQETAPTEDDVQDDDNARPQKRKTVRFRNSVERRSAARDSFPEEPKAAPVTRVEKKLEINNLSTVHTNDIKSLSDSTDAALAADALNQGPVESRRASRRNKSNLPLEKGQGATPVQPTLPSPHEQAQKPKRGRSTLNLDVNKDEIAAANVIDCREPLEEKPKGASTKRGTAKSTKCIRYENDDNKSTIS